MYKLREIRNQSKDDFQTAAKIRGKTELIALVHSVSTLISKSSIIALDLRTTTYLKCPPSKNKTSPCHDHTSL
jgi:hypothetical protein